MKVIFVLFDSLNRDDVAPYGGRGIETPNLSRFAERALRFDNHFVGSLPCMPARRDLQTGRLNFMHRSWGPLEPFDNSLPRLLSGAGVYSHIITDHLHYFEDGGAGYVTAFDSWEFMRGQENDPWTAVVDPPLAAYRRDFDPRHYPFDFDEGKATRETVSRWQWKKLCHANNRARIATEDQFPTVQCFDRALDFLERNWAADDWFLQLEVFDPHEPFHAPDRFREKYPSDWAGGILDWPPYERVVEDEATINEIKSRYSALVSMCDDQFGRLLDFIDGQGWDDVCVIVSSDHGYLLAEHGWWGKNRMPYYTGISRIPLLVRHPDAPGGGAVARLTQATDLMPTILSLFGIEPPREATGTAIDFGAPSGDGGAGVRIFGMFGGPIGATDGRYIYFRYPCNIHGDGLFEYTLSLNHMNGPFQHDELRDIEIWEPFDFTRDMRVLRIAATRDAVRPAALHEHFSPCPAAELFDLSTDPGQTTPIDDREVELRFVRDILAQLDLHDAPHEYYGHYRLPAPAAAGPEPSRGLAGLSGEMGR